MPYKCLAQTFYAIGQYRLEPLREQDMAKIKSWRNEQINVLRQKHPLTDEDQVRYFRHAVAPTFTEDQPKIILFSYLKNDKCIGYGGFTNIDWESQRAEISFLLDTSRIPNHEQYKEDFSTFLNLLKTIAFSELRWNRLFTETYDIRPHHVAVLEACGFQFEGRLRKHIWLEESWVDSLFHGCLRGE